MRERIDLIHDVLSAASGGAIKTHIMYGVVLSHTLVNKYLNLLMEQGLIAKEGRRYRTTKKGLEFQETYKAMKSLLGESEE